MDFDWHTFNLLEFIGGFVLALLLWTGEKIFVKPKLSASISKPSNLFPGKLKSLNLLVSNQKRKWLLSLLNSTATQVRINIRYLNYNTRKEFLNVIARWNSTREPVTPDYLGVDVGLALVGTRELLIPGQSEEISVAIKQKGDKKCYPFNNESYLYYKSNFLKPEWEIEEDKFIVTIEAQAGEVHKELGKFVVINSTNFDDFEIVKLDSQVLHKSKLSLFSVFYDISKLMRKEVLVPVIITAVVFAGAGFFGGMQYQKSQRGAFGGDRQGNFMMRNSGEAGQRMGGPGGAGGQRMGFRPTVGEIISADDKSITVKMDDGSSKIVLISETTLINKTDPGSKTDLSVGTKVGVFGADNNGTITAQNIQINPQQMRTGTPSASPQ